MRLCRFRHSDREQLGLYHEDFILSLEAAAHAFAVATGQRLPLPTSSSLLDFLPPTGPGFAQSHQLAEWVGKQRGPIAGALPTKVVQLLVPIARPNKLFLLAGNYAEHIREGGDTARERHETFPYVFMKPPTTTLTDPGESVRIPAVSPKHIDWELELAVIIGQKIKGVKEADALDVVAGYTIINDISDRKFRPNPDRKKREKDTFFDWMHGKWHDGFCPCGPCVLSADAVPDPQALPMRLTVNGETKQNASTGLMVFPVAAVIEFIASFVTLEPGDIISTGTPSGVGNATGTYLRPGDRVEATIEGIGTLVTPVEG